MSSKTAHASDLFVQCLENEGVDYVIGVPGEENLDFIDSVRKSKSVKLVVTRHEQPAAFMASTIGRLTGKSGVCLSTLGPGATNLMTGAAYAQLGGMPMMMITGQKPIRKSKQGQFQILDVVEMMKPTTKFAKQIVAGSLIPSQVREAFRRAEEERPGAVHLELPEDIAREIVEDPLQPFAIDRTRRPVAEDKAITKAIEMIKSAKFPLLCIGAGANRKQITTVLEDFVNKFQIPFCNTQMGKGVIPENHALFLGTAALSSNDYVHCAIAKADLIIMVGHDVVEKPPFFMEQGGSKVIHINFYSANVDDVYFPTLEVVGDVANAVWRLTQEMEPSESWSFDYYKRVKVELDSHVLAGSDDTRFPVIPQRFVASIRKVMPDNGILTLDNGVYKIWFARNYPALQPNTILLDNALATMGAGLPSAMGARLVHPDFKETKIMAVCGDGGFMMNSQEIETCVRLNLNITCIILNDGAYGMIKWKQSQQGLAEFGLDYGNPDFVKYAEAYGAFGHRVTKSEELEPILTKCLETKGFHLVDLAVDYSENERVLIKELSEAACLI